MYSNKQSTRRTFYIYCTLLIYKSVSCKQICDEFEIQTRAFQKYMKQVKDAIELLKLPYIIRYDYKMKRYELIELPINMIDTSYELTEAQEKELAMIKIYNYLRQGVKINSNTLYRLYKWDDKTAREFIRNMAYNLYQVSHKEYIYFDESSKSFYLYIAEDDYEDYYYEDWINNIYEFKD